MSGEWTFQGTEQTIGPGVAGGTTPPELPDRYEDRGLIGAGSMGEVRRVYDQHLRREVAMKIIAWGLADTPRARSRFIAEANLSARLQHPGIVPVHDRGVSVRGRAWFTMPLVRGHTFNALLAELHVAVSQGSWQTTPSGWTFRRLLSVLGTACDAVAYAHSEGVIHRDLKPGNIMVGAFGQVQVMDWGISGLLTGPEDGLPGIQIGVSGTPAFMAPEQADGSPDAQGPWTDIYALGTILFVLLTGQAPYHGDPAQILACIRNAETSPSVIDSIPPGHPRLAEPLVRLCEEAMARRSEDRPRRALDVARRIKAWLDGELRRDQARKMVHDARPDKERAIALRTDADGLRQASDVLLAPLPPNAPVARKAAA
ncbi:MAG: serine/threonine protein kinase, partial [Myxococcota bacterium]